MGLLFDFNLHADHKNHKYVYFVYWWWTDTFCSSSVHNLFSVQQMVLSCPVCCWIMAEDKSGQTFLSYISAKVEFCSSNCSAVIAKNHSCILYTTVVFLFVKIWLTLRNTAWTPFVESMCMTLPHWSRVPHAMIGNFLRMRDWVNDVAEAEFLIDVELYSHLNLELHCAR